MGTPEFAVPSLNALLGARATDGWTVTGVVTQPDRPKGRGQALTASPIKQLALRHHLPIWQPLKMKDPAFLDALAGWQPDLIAVTAFGRILPKAILALPPRGCINVHGSLLPKYRGAGPVQWALINGERETGITTMLMDEGMDTGAMLLQETVPIDPEDTAGTLSVRLAEVGGRLLVETIRRWLRGDLAPRQQDPTQATPAPLLKKEDGLVDWTLSAQVLADRIRGLTPWPGAYTYAEPDRWTICRAVASQDDPRGVAPGTLLRTGKDGLLVATGQGSLLVTEIQPSGGKRMTVAQYLAGHPLAPGLRLSSGPDAAPLASSPSHP